MTKSIEAFRKTIDQVYGAYLDANAGFASFKDHITRIQSQNTAFSESSGLDLDSLQFFHGRGNPNEPESVVLHEVTQGELKHRNQKDGENSLFLGRMSVVAIY